MLEFKTLIYKNIMSVGNSPITIKLNTHSKTLITGKNGSGKSTMLEALCFVLFGKPFRRLNKPQLINSVNQKNMFVSIEFSDGKHQFKIDRGMRPNIFQIFKDGALIEEDASVGDYQQFLETSILKINMNTFKQIVVLGTAGFTPFMLLPAAARRAIVEDLLDISIFSTMTDLNKQQYKILVDNIKEIDSEIKRLVSEIKIHVQYEKERKQKSEEKLQEYIASLSSAVTQYQEIVLQIGDVNAELDDTLSKVADSVASQIKEYQKMVSDANAEIRQINKTIKFFNDNNYCSVCQQPISEEHKHEIVNGNNNKLQKFSDAEKTLKAKLMEYTAIEEERKTLTDKITELQNRIASLNAQKKMIKTHAETLKKQIIDIKSENEKKTKEKEILQLREYIGINDEKRTVLNEEKYCRDVVSSILKDSGVKRLIIKKYIPIINKLINEYLSQLGANYNFILDEEFNESIKSRGRDNFSYSSFSQGERCRIDLSLLFAFRDLVSIKTGSMSNILILDEIYDSAADSEGVDYMNKILSKLKDHVFIISHNDKHQGFDRHLKMIKVGNFSRMDENEEFE